MDVLYFGERMSMKMFTPLMFKQIMHILFIFLTFGYLVRFNLLEEESIEFKNFHLRDNIAQLCIFEVNI